MARTTAVAMQCAPSGAVYTTVATNASAWVPGSWVEFIASTSTDIQIASLSWGTLGSGGGQFEVDVGIGAAASEVVVGTFRVMMTNPGSDDLNSVIVLPTPISVIPTSSRVALRVAQRSAGAENYTFAFNYYEALESDNLHDGTLDCLPSKADGVSVTPNATGWVDSSWVQVSASLPASIDVAGLGWAVGSGPSAVDIEFDIGVGASSSEVVVTTLRTCQLENNAGRQKMCFLPSLLPIDVGNRVAVRLRKGGTSTTAFSVALLYYSPSDEASVSGLAMPLVDGGLVNSGLVNRGLVS